MEKRNNNSQDSAKNINNNKEEIEDNLTKVYSLHKKVGKGAYGIVYKATHTITNRTVAIKKIFNAFSNETNSKRTYREIFFLQQLRSHPNIITLLKVHRSTSLKDMYLIFEYMDIDLHNYIKLVKKLNVEPIRYIIYQILRGLKYIHSGNVIHRDLKPSNILLNSRCEAKIADFGLARSLRSKERNFTEKNLTEYVATRWYRAPEILLGCKKYSKAIDMWSVGCILAEMTKGAPLFPGTSTINQLELILKAVPERELIEVNELYTGVGKKLLEWTPEKRISIKKILSDAPGELIDLTSKLIAFNPKKRFNVVDGLRHPFLLKYHNPLSEPCLGRPLYQDNKLSNKTLTPRILPSRQQTVDKTGSMKTAQHQYHEEMMPFIVANTKKMTRIPLNQRQIRNPAMVNSTMSRAYSLNYIKDTSSDEITKYYSEKYPILWLK